MNRLFDTHHIRPELSLDGIWDFTMEGVDKAYTMPVPGVWEQHPDFNVHRGVGTYSRTVYVKNHTNLRLEFKGVSHTAHVYFDGQKVAHHYNAFTPFACLIKNVEKGWHTLEVKVDNRFGPDSALHIPNDYFTYGGIIRPVTLEELPGAYLKWVHFTPTLTDGAWSGKTQICVESLSDTPLSLTLTTSLAGVGQAQSFTLAPNATQVLTFTAAYPQAKCWCHQDPQLYLLETVLEGEGFADDLIERVGFRTVSWDKHRLMINGKCEFLKGFNRHEDIARMGCAVPVQMMAHDMDLMLDMGANAVRTCHYPNDERFLDLCDQKGMLVWEENHARGQTLEEMLNPNFQPQCEVCIDEMIENHYNHPSIVIWGILNECASDEPQGRELYARQYEQIKRLDPTRPTTHASNRYYKDICLDLPDMVSYNLYNGWYFNLSSAQELDKTVDWIQTQTGGKDKPMIVSEFGAGAVYGHRDTAREKWSEEGQCDILEENITTYLNNPHLTGMFIWMFADCRITGYRESKLFKYRPKTQNNKGVVDFYRRPKLAYYTVQKLFREDKGRKEWES